MERRRKPRTDTNVQLNCRAPASPCRATVHDVSDEGCRIEMPTADLTLGGTVLLELPSAPRFAGRVVWKRGRQAGIRFARRLEGSAAIALGLDVPEPEAVPVAALVTVEQPKLQTLLRHWMRRLAGGLA